MSAEMKTGIQKRFSLSSTNMICFLATALKTDETNSCTNKVSKQSFTKHTVWETKCYIHTNCTQQNVVQSHSVAQIHFNRSTVLKTNFTKKKPKYKQWWYITWQPADTTQYIHYPCALSTVTFLVRARIFQAVQSSKPRPTVCRVTYIWRRINVLFTGYHAESWELRAESDPTWTGGNVKHVMSKIFLKDVFLDVFPDVFWDANASLSSINTTTKGKVLINKDNTAKNSH